MNPISCKSEPSSKLQSLMDLSKDPERSCVSPPQTLRAETVDECASIVCIH